MGKSVVRYLTTQLICVYSSVVSYGQYRITITIAAMGDGNMYHGMQGRVNTKCKGGGEFPISRH